MKQRRAKLEDGFVNARARDYTLPKPAAVPFPIRWFVLIVLIESLTEYAELCGHTPRVTKGETSMTSGSLPDAHSVGHSTFTRNRSPYDMLCRANFL
jgi:hypothetical protein